MLKNLNGWQRIWLVFTIISALWWLVFWPIKTFNESERANEGYQAALGTDFASGKCQTFITSRLDALVEPPFGNGGGGTCWHIYTTRTIHKIDAVPFTKEVSDKMASRERLISIFEILGWGLILTLSASGFLYLAGFIVGWVRGGFKRTDKRNRNPNGTPDIL
jgi:hypothetical protein